MAGSAGEANEGAGASRTVILTFLEMHIMQRTIYAPTKTNIDMEEKKWIEFREKIDLKSKTM